MAKMFKTNEIFLSWPRFTGLSCLIGLSLLVLECLGTTPYLSGQSPSYSHSRDYAAVLTELSRKEIRPSRLGAGDLAKTTLTPILVESHATAKGLTLETALWRLEIQKTPWTLSLVNKKTGVVWQMVSEKSVEWTRGGKENQTSNPLSLESITRFQKQGGGWAMQARVRGSNEPVQLKLSVLSPNVIRFSVHGGALGKDAKLGLRFTAPGPFYGLGERYVKTELNGLKTTLIPTDHLGEPGHNWTYIPVPYVLTPQGMGVYLDTAQQSTFDFRQAGHGEFSTDLDGPSTDCYFLVSDGPKGIIEAYTGLMGRTPLQPPWTFGVWLTALQGKDATIAVAKRLREDKIPVSAIWVYDQVDADANIGWPYWTTGYYGSPRDYTDELHKMGFKVLTYLNNFVWSRLPSYTLPNPTFQEGMRQGFFAQYPDGSVKKILDNIPIGNIDFTNPRAVDWWGEMLRRIVVDYNYDGWMEDFGEGGWIGDGFHFSNGLTMREMATLYSLIYHRTAYKITQRLRPGIVRFARSGYSGSESYSINWGGDQIANWTPDGGLPAVIPAGITAGLSGYDVWAPDIVSYGFSKELWIRWVEYGALTPIMRDHLERKPKCAVDLWFDSQTLDTFRRYARLHNSLFPYLYTYAHEASKTGLPIIRHLMLEWPKDSNTYAADHEYLLGRQILVAPVVKEGTRTRDLYLPGGFWVNYWTAQIIQGGRRVTVPAPLEQIPIFVRAGSVIPLVNPDIQTLAAGLAGGKYRTLDNGLIWRVFPAAPPAQSAFTLYDGTHATARQELAETELQVENSPKIRKYQAVFPTPKAIHEVTLSGRPLQKLTCAALTMGKQGWCLNPRDSSLQVRFVADNFTLKITE